MRGRGYTGGTFAKRSLGASSQGLPASPDPEEGDEDGAEGATEGVVGETIRPPRPSSGAGRRSGPVSGAAASGAFGAAGAAGACRSGSRISSNDLGVSGRAPRTSRDRGGV